MQFTTQNLDQLRDEVTGIVAKAGAYILDHFRRVSAHAIRDKGDNSLVSDVDEMAEQLLMSDLLSLIPDAGILAEETGNNMSNENLVWVIDPLDGTTNYLFGLPSFAVSVALVQQGKPLLGVIYDPVMNEMFSAHYGGSARLNGVEIQVSQRTSLHECLIAMGFPVSRHDQIPALLGCMEYFIHHTRGVRRWGSAALDLAHVACGRYDAFAEYGLSVWDIAAGVLIVECAGGKVSDLTGGNQHLQSGEILASSNAVYKEILQVTNDFFGKK